MKRMWCGVRVAVSALGLALSGIATAQAPAADPPAGDADIVVRGQTQKQLHATVQALTPTDYGRQVGRWKEEICFKVVGLNDEHAGLIRKQFLIETGRLHLRVSASAGCSANLLVVIADNADEITAKIYKDERWMFGDPAYGNPPRARVDALMKAQPVRWFVTNRKVRAFNSGASHIVMPTREDTDYAYVLVDVNRLSGITWRQLGDYATFVALAGPQPGASFRKSSILSIFANRDAGDATPERMAPEDERFLDALYRSDSDLPAEQQRRDIERLMTSGAPPPK